jgi:hypothetical protein
VYGKQAALEAAEAARDAAEAERDAARASEHALNASLEAAWQEAEVCTLQLVYTPKHIHWFACQ